MKKPILVITPGDPDGIGPEVTAKALLKLKGKLKSYSIVVFGSATPFRKNADRWGNIFQNKKIDFFEPPTRSSPGYQSGWAIETATRFMMAAPMDRVMVTGPIHKSRLNQGGYFFNGHTDFLAALTRTKNVTMMLLNDLFRVALVTNHCPLSSVSRRITSAQLKITFEHAREFSARYLRKKKSKVAILGLNPHAGEDTLLGPEEKKIILPAMAQFQKKRKDCLLSGPHPADSFFAIEAMRPKSERHDVIVAMYHDQGLIPIKLSDFSNSLNVTLGLPFIRTSVDHGTAFDIANQNKADPKSMVYAIKKALEYSGETHANE